jgi:hypothetical protein
MVRHEGQSVFPRHGLQADVCTGIQPSREVEETAGSGSVELGNPSGFGHGRGMPRFPVRFRLWDVISKNGTHREVEGRSAVGEEVLESATGLKEYNPLDPGRFGEKNRVQDAVPPHYGPSIYRTSGSA